MFSGQYGIYKDIVVAGVYTFSFIPQVLDRWAGGADNIRTVCVRCHKPVYIGETNVLSGQITGKRQVQKQNIIAVDVEVNNSWKEVLIRAAVELVLDG